MWVDPSGGPKPVLWSHEPNVQLERERKKKIRYWLCYSYSNLHKLKPHTQEKVWVKSREPKLTLGILPNGLKERCPSAITWGLHTSKSSSPSQCHHWVAYTVCSVLTLAAHSTPLPKAFSLHLCKSLGQLLFLFIYFLPAPLSSSFERTHVWLISAMMLFWSFHHEETGPLLPLPLLCMWETAQVISWSFKSHPKPSQLSGVSGKTNIRGLLFKLHQAVSS